MYWIIRLFFLVSAVVSIRVWRWMWMFMSGLMPPRLDTTNSESDATTERSDNTEDSTSYHSYVENDTEEIEEDSTYLHEENRIEEIGIVQLNEVSSTDNVVIRDRWIIWKYKMLLGIGGPLIGYARFVTGGMLGMPEFLIRISEEIFTDKAKALEDNFCIYQNRQLSLYSSIIPIAGLIATILTVFFKRWGRRSLVFGTLLSVIGSICMSWFPHISVDIFGRILVGFGVGLLNQVIPTMVLEVLVEDEKRVWAILFQVFITFGSTIAAMDNLIASNYHVWGWRMSSGVLGFLSAMLLGLSISTLESPFFLVEQGKLEKAKQVLRTIRGVSDVELEYREIMEIIDNERQENSFIEILRNKNRPALVINTILTALAPFLGAEVLLMYGPYLLQSLNYKMHEAFLASFFLSLANSSSRGVGLYIIEFFGRIRVYTVACVASLIAQIFLGVIFHLNQNLHHHLSYQRAVAALALVVISTIAYGVLPGPLDWLHSSYPKNCAALGSKIKKCINLLFTVLNNQVTFYLLCVAREWTFLLFVLSCLVYFCFIYAFVPETKGINQDEMDENVWRHHWYWKRYMTNRSPNSST